jgi:hypothetical protein
MRRFRCHQRNLHEQRPQWPRCVFRAGGDPPTSPVFAYVEFGSGRYGSSIAPSSLAARFTVACGFLPVLKLSNKSILEAKARPYLNSVQKSPEYRHLS